MVSNLLFHFFLYLLQSCRAFDGSSQKVIELLVKISYVLITSVCLEIPMLTLIGNKFFDTLPRLGDTYVLHC